VSTRRTVAFTFEGRAISAEPGQSVAAALLAAGVRSWRTTRVEGRPRGLFCGIGICHDCLVELNGETGTRACLVEVHEGDRVEPQQGVGRDELA
jgi:predicted molibdopterin-dependent oxidoreductase YjgC